MTTCIAWRHWRGQSRNNRNHTVANNVLSLFRTPFLNVTRRIIGGAEDSLR